MFWFRNGTTQLSVPLTLSKPLPLTHSPLPSPASPYGWLERRIGRIEGKYHSLWEEQFTRNSNEIRKRTVTATLPMTEGRRNEQFPQKPPENSQYLTTPSAMLTWLEETPSPKPGSDMRWYRIMSRSYPWPPLAVAKINPVLARTRTLSTPCSIPSIACPDTTHFNYIYVYTSRGIITIVNGCSCKISIELI